MFHPIVSDVCWLVYCRLQIIIFLKRSGQWCSWYISNVTFLRFVDLRRIYLNLIVYDFLLFARNFSNWLFAVFFFFARNCFNLIAGGLFNFFALIFLITIFSPILVVSIYLTIFLIPAFFSRYYTGIIDGNIDGNVISVFNIYRALLQIRRETLRLFSNNKMISNVFIVIFVLCHKLFRITDEYICWYARVFMCWIT